MNPTIKLHLGSAGFCLVLISLNWFRSVDYARGVGIVSEGIDAFALALLIAAMTTVYLARHCLRLVRRLKEKGVTISSGGWIASPAVVLYALPLGYHRLGSSMWVEPDGAHAIARFGYGHDASAWIFFGAVASLLLFQVLMKLKAAEEGAEPSATDNPGYAHLNLRRLSSSNIPSGVSELHRSARQE